MSKTIDLRTTLISELKAITDGDVFFGKASEDATFPYCVCELSRTVVDSFDIYTLEINIWDNSESTARVETLADAIEEAFDAQIIHDQQKTIALYKQIRSNVQDPTKDIQRVMLRFDLQHFWKGNL